MVGNPAAEVRKDEREHPARVRLPKAGEREKDKQKSRQEKLIWQPSRI